MSAVARPTSVEEVVSLVRAATAGVRVRGAASTGIAPTDGALDLRLDALGGVVTHRPDDLIVTVRAGMRLDELADVLREQRQRLPVAPWPGAGGTVGGAVAAGADGLVGCRGMRLSDAVLGVQAVLGDGAVVRVGAAVVKSVAGFDVARALVGSRGVLAVLTEVTLRVEALPPAATELRADCADEAAVAAACAAALADPLEPRGLAVRRAEGHDGFVVALELCGPQRAVAAAELRVAHAGFAHDEANGLLARWTETLARAPHRRRLWCSRAAPAASLRGHRGGVADVRRGVTFVPSDAPEALAPAALWTPLRAAFDPGGTFRPGRGLGVA